MTHPTNCDPLCSYCERDHLKITLKCTEAKWNEEAITELEIDHFAPTFQERLRNGEEL